MASSSTSQRYWDTHRLMNYGFAVRNDIVAGAEPDPDPLQDPKITGPFVDIPASAWYHDSVMLMWENGIMRGVTASTFEPHAPMTRAGAASVIYRAAREPDVPYLPLFTDIPDGEWYTAPVIWAGYASIIEGYEDGAFRPHDIVNREQFAVIIYRFAYAAGYDVSARADLDAYADADEVSDWAYDALSCCVAMGLINGTTAMTLEPNAAITRAQCAAVLTRAAVGAQD
jgi:hypothetical protein